MAWREGLLLIPSRTSNMNLDMRVHSVDEVLPRVKMRRCVVFDALEGDCYIQKTESRASEAGGRCLLHPKIGMLGPHLRYFGRAVDRNGGARLFLPSKWGLPTLVGLKAAPFAVVSITVFLGLWRLFRSLPWPQVGLWFFFLPRPEG